MDEAQRALILHLASKHLANSDQYNERNPGVGFRLPIGDGGYYMGAGAYRNSLGRTSAYAGAGKEVLTLGDILGLRLNAGLITGYQEALLPFLIPELRLALGNNSELLLNYIPRVKHDGIETEPTLGVSLGIPFGGRRR